MPENRTSESKIKVLHVDDDENQLDMTRTFLELMDNCLQVKSEPSPNAALKKLEHGKFDCIVLDFKMPEMDGIELARRIKKKHNISIILYTGQGSEDVAEKAFAIGVDDYLHKEESPSHYQLLAKRIRDAVEKKRIEILYRKSVERYRALMNLAPDGITTLNTRGIVTFANPSMASLTGHTEEELIGKWFPKMGTMRVSDMPRFLSIFADIVRGRVPQPTEFVYVRKDGSEGWGEAHISLIKQPGEKMEILAILRDVTERKHLISELEQKSEYFEAQAEEKTRQLLNSERMSAAGAIAAQLGHDLRGPLNTITNATYLLEHHPEKTSGMIPIINKAIENVTQLLDEMRIRTQEISLNCSEVDLDAYIASFIDESLIPENIRVENKLKSQARVSIDIIKMRRVLTNILLNAFDAMKDGGKVWISTKSKDEYILIVIKDNGSGIPDDIKANLFKPFVTSKSNGTGLGLNFCKRIVEAHHGEISVESTLGSGTSFSLKLPKILAQLKTVGKKVEFELELVPTPHTSTSQIIKMFDNVKINALKDKVFKQI
ncbi:MAG: response regulator [Candidatus Bathyarchaeota archaeon]|nr:response regulator [Candidatus Bathyarchaeota archaeon]